MEYDNKNTFVLFQNDKKAENHPDWKGTLTDENGKEWDIAVWERTSKKGSLFLSGKVSEPFKKTEGAPSWEAAREKYTKKDEVLTDEQVDEPIDLSEIPFN